MNSPLSHTSFSASPPSHKYFPELSLGLIGPNPTESIGASLPAPDFWVRKWDARQGPHTQSPLSDAPLFWEFGAYGTLEISGEVLEREIRKAHLHVAQTLDPHLGTILLNHPEVYLLQGEEHGPFYDRLKESFLTLQKLFEEGLISGFGISSRGVTLDPSDPAFVSLAALTDLFRTTSKQSLDINDAGLPTGFKVLSFPLNLLEPGSLFGAAQDGHSVLDWIKVHKLRALIERPTLAWTGHYFMDLNEQPYGQTLNHGKTFNFEELKGFFEGLNEAEKALSDELKTELKARFKLFPLSSLLKHRATEFMVIERFQHGLSAWLTNEYLPGLESISASPKTHHLAQYIKAILEWREAFESHLTDLKVSELREFSTRLDAVVPSLRQVPPLHLKFLAMLRAIAKSHLIPVGVILPPEVFASEGAWDEWTNAASRSRNPVISMEDTLDAWEKFLESYALSESADTVD